jgi:hypothetical protein
MGTSIPAQGGQLSYAVQPGKIGNDGTFDHTDLEWFKVRALNAELGPIQEQLPAPLEISGPPMPDGSYKQSYAFAGQASFIPRLEDSFGLLLLGAMGSASSITGMTADAVPMAGVNTHIFRYVPTNMYYQPWLAVRRTIPHHTLSEVLGESGYDCKIGNIRVTAPAKGKIACQFQMVGRDYVQDDDISDWAYENVDFEDFTSSPDAGRGQFSVGGQEIPVIGATIEIMNELSVAQETVLGDFRLDDITTLNRGVQIRFVYKYESPALYQELFNGGAGNLVWDSLPFIRETDEDGYALDIRFESSMLIPGTSRPYGLRIRADRVTLAQNGPIALTPGALVVQEFIATVISPAGGGSPLELVLENDAISYLIPA